MIAEADLVVGVVITAIAADEFRLPVALESRASHDIKDSVGAVAIFGAIAAALNLEIIDVLGIKLRADIGSNVGVGYGHPIKQPRDLVSAANVKLIMDQVSAGCVVRDHVQAVGLVGAWSLSNLLSADHAACRR